MTVSQVQALRKIYDAKKRGYNLYINSTNDMFPSKSQESILAYDDGNEIVHCIRRAANPYLSNNTANIASSSYDQIIKFDMNIERSELESVLDTLIKDGQVSAEDAEYFIKRMDHPWKNPQNVKVEESVNK